MADLIVNTQDIATRRIESIDVIRGLTILVMLFVNDVAGVIGVPNWMEHIPTGTDGMTFVDVVFPSFLFIVGMAIPFALAKRLERGESILKVWKHVLIRTISLLIIGVFMVNSGSLSRNALINQNIWALLMYAGIMMAWNVMPGVSKSNKYLYFGIKSFGIILLIIAALIFRGNNMTGLIQLTPKWWGILGLIGWAYFIACLFYIPMRNHISGIIAGVALLYCVYMADESGYFVGFAWISNWVNIGKFLGTHSAIVLSGVALGMILSPASPIQTHSARIRWAFWYGVALAAAGSMLHQLSTVHKMFIIDKNLATPSWGLWSSAFTVWIFVVIYWLIDIREWKGWIKIVEPAGNNALFAYILAPVFYALFSLLAGFFNGFNFYGWLGGSFILGFFRAIIFAFLMTWLTGVLRKKGLWLKL